ncbi:MAG: DNA internalization-related competence protein ComEC/Rec2 [Gemmatimonadota bacterium]
MVRVFRRVEAGVPVRVYGVRFQRPFGTVVVADSVGAGDAAGAPIRPTAARGDPIRWALIRWRGRLVGWAQELYGPRAAMVSALLLARREGLDPGLKDAFARAGAAHLLAISGFHVGIIAALLAGLLLLLGVPGRGALPLAVVGVWAYTALLGFPEAAARAALMLNFGVAARLRGRPPARWSGLAAAFLLLAVQDPRRLGHPGFQLSFAGVAGLTAWSASFQKRLDGLLRHRLLPGAVAGRFPGGVRAFTSAVAAALAATLATLPVVVWHFESVPLVGIPVTLMATPLVTLALPGALATLMLYPAAPGVASFLAGGVDLTLAALEALVLCAAEKPWSSLWAPRIWAPLAVLGWLAGASLARRASVRRLPRRGMAALATATLLVGWPLVAQRFHSSRLELLVMDVGQGDAIALRTPAGRWILVDAGPPPREGGTARVVSTLRRRGVRRLDALVLTHPDADHIGGAAAVLRSFRVGAVIDPGRAAGKAGYVELLREARRRGVPWRIAEAGETWRMDGVILEVLHPPPGDAGPRQADFQGRGTANDVSVVLQVRYGAFDALLTGDAPAAVERRLASRRLHPGLEVLKVGHHGSNTSTDSLLLARTRPAVALISVGRGNRFGHPAPAVLARLRRAGVEVRRTDREGHLRVLAGRDGTFRVLSGRY